MGDLSTQETTCANFGRTHILLVFVVGQVLGPAADELRQHYRPNDGRLDKADDRQGASMAKRILSASRPLRSLRVRQYLLSQYPPRLNSKVSNRTMRRDEATSLGRHKQPLCVRCLAGKRAATNEQPSPHVRHCLALLS